MLMKKRGIWVGRKVYISLFGNNFFKQSKYIEIQQFYKVSTSQSLKAISDQLERGKRLIKTLIKMSKRAKLSNVSYRSRSWSQSLKGELRSQHHQIPLRQYQLDSEQQDSNHLELSEADVLLLQIRETKQKFSQLEITIMSCNKRQQIYEEKLTSTRSDQSKQHQMNIQSITKSLNNCSKLIQSAQKTQFERGDDLEVQAKQLRLRLDQKKGRKKCQRRSLMKKYVELKRPLIKRDWVWERNREKRLKPKVNQKKEIRELRKQKEKYSGYYFEQERNADAKEIQTWQSRFQRSIMQWTCDRILLKSTNKIIIIKANKLITNAVGCSYGQNEDFQSLIANMDHPLIPLSKLHSRIIKIIFRCCSYHYKCPQRAMYQDCC